MSPHLPVQGTDVCTEVQTSWTSSSGMTHARWSVSVLTDYLLPELEGGTAAQPVTAQQKIEAGRSIHLLSGKFQSTQWPR